MTLRTRDIIIRILFSLMAASFLLSLIGAVLIPWDSPLLQQRAREIADYRNNPFGAIVSNILLVSLVHLVSIILIAIFIRNFRRAGSWQLFYIILFWYGTCWVIVRIAALYLISVGAPDQYLMMASRISLLGRLFSVFMFFAASLSGTGFKLQRHAIIIGSSVLMGLWLSVAVPLDTTRIGSSFLYDPPGSFSMVVFTFVISAMTVMNTVRNALVSRERQDVLMIIPFLLCTVGFNCMYLNTGLIPVSLGLACFSTGSIWMMQKHRSSNTWY